MIWIRVIKVLGLITVLSYMITILSVWMVSSYLGYAQFSVQEPIQIVKYAEWVLGIIGVVVIISILKKETIELITEWFKDE